MNDMKNRNPSHLACIPVLKYLGYIHSYELTHPIICIASLGDNLTCLTF